MQKGSQKDCQRGYFFAHQKRKDQIFWKSRFGKESQDEEIGEGQDFSFFENYSWKTWIQIRLRMFQDDAKSRRRRRRKGEKEVRTAARERGSNRFQMWKLWGRERERGDLERQWPSGAASRASELCQQLLYSPELSDWLTDPCTESNQHLGTGFTCTLMELLRVDRERTKIYKWLHRRNQLSRFLTNCREVDDILRNGYWVGNQREGNKTGHERWNENGLRYLPKESPRWTHISNVRWRTRPTWWTHLGAIKVWRAWRWQKYVAAKIVDPPSRFNGLEPLLDGRGGKRVATRYIYSAISTREKVRCYANAEWVPPSMGTHLFRLSRYFHVFGRRLGRRPFPASLTCRPSFSATAFSHKIHAIFFCHAADRPRDALTSSTGSRSARPARSARAGVARAGRPGPPHKMVARASPAAPTCMCVCRSLSLFSLLFFFSSPFLLWCVLDGVTSLLASSTAPVCAWTAEWSVPCSCSCASRGPSGKAVGASFFSSGSGRSHCRSVRRSVRAVVRQTSAGGSVGGRVFPSHVGRQRGQVPPPDEEVSEVRRPTSRSTRVSPYLPSLSARPTHRTTLSGAPGSTCPPCIPATSGSTCFFAGTRRATSSSAPWFLLVYVIALDSDPARIPPDGRATGYASDFRDPACVCDRRQCLRPPRPRRADTRPSPALRPPSMLRPMSLGASASPPSPSSPS